MIIAERAPGLPPEPSVSALAGALDVSWRLGGHDHRLMRDTALELARLHAARGSRDEGGGADAHRALQLATHYLSLGALLSQQHHLLFVDTAALCKESFTSPGTTASDAFTVGDIQDMGLHARGDVDAGRATRYLLALRREADAPSGFADEFALRNAEAACRVHRILFDHFGTYRERCCVDAKDLVLEDGAQPAVPEALVCIQWVEAPPPVDEDLQSSDGIYPFIEAHVLLGVTVHKPTNGASPPDDRFADAPHILRVAPKKVSDVRAMQRHVSELRYALQRTLSHDAAEVSKALRDKFDALLCDVHIFLNPHSVNDAVFQGKLRDAKGYYPGVECSIETLMLLEHFFSRDLGTRASHPALCYFFRDCFEE